MKLPNELYIVGKKYKIIYCDKPSEVDYKKREALWGQIDYWSRTIRVYKGAETTVEDVLHTLMHEVIHAVTDHLKIRFDDDKEEDIVDLLALGITNVLIDNKFNFSEKDKKK